MLVGLHQVYFFLILSPAFSIKLLVGACIEFNFTKRCSEIGGIKKSIVIRFGRRNVPIPITDSIVQVDIP